MNSSKISTPQINTPKLDFVFYGGCPSLDLFNTLRRRKDPQHVTEDLLLQQDGLKKWLLKAQHRSGWAELLPPLHPNARNAVVSKDLQTQAIQLRSIIERLLAKDFVPEDIHTLNQMAQLKPYWQLSIEDGVLVTKHNLELESVLGLIAEDCMQLFSSNLCEKIKECAHERCGIVFLDRSNGSKRNWCSMKECGNRAKASRFAQKD
ncbi:CGNR zinc finger domain-containing protein [Psychrobacter sp. I-STPA10]|uniref:CGNR zinc finger domain-containing protein n=1 Tax=Psychrobacter sp. I-STPA10 TaxID=2585769 RepID=UPI001E2C7A5D|nr:CGNR zinc finger domain-containing protein [Psychrobacter sp. I-STPA10]